MCMTFDGPDAWLALVNHNLGGPIEVVFRSEGSFRSFGYCMLDMLPVKRRSRVGKGCGLIQYELLAKDPLSGLRVTIRTTRLGNEAAPTTRKHSESASGYSEKSSDHPHVLLLHHSHIV